MTDLHIFRVPVPSESYAVIDRDRYDGAPDGDTTVGYGRTAEEAIQDLREQYGEHESL